MARLHDGAQLEIPLLARLDWADLELKRLDDAAEAFLKDQAVTTRAEPNPESTEYVVRVEKGVEDLPVEIPLMIGDIAHHARSTLDWLAWSIARYPCKNTSFPIWASPSIDKNGRRIQPFVAGGLNAAAKRAVKQLQPYERWKANPLNSPLYWLRELDNVHKHRHLVAAACSHSGYFRELPAGWRGEAEAEYFASELKAGEKLARIAFSEPNPGLDFDYYAVPYISVAGIDPSLDGLNSIVGELRYMMLRLVRGIVIEFAQAGLMRR